MWKKPSGFRVHYEVTAVIAIDFNREDNNGDKDEDCGDDDVDVNKGQQWLAKMMTGWNSMK